MDWFFFSSETQEKIVELFYYLNALSNVFLKKSMMLNQGHFLRNVFCKCKHCVKKEEETPFNINLNDL